MELIEVVESLFTQYGYYVLVAGLPLDFIALPIPPGNSTLTYSGYLAYKGVLDGKAALLLAWLGAIIGVTITYLIGYRLGMPFIDKYGKCLVKPAAVQKTKQIYDKYGDKLLFIVFFAPGIRQFIGYYIGILRIPFWRVALYAYSGAILWVTVFYSIGYAFGEQWHMVFALINRYLNVLFVALGGLLLVGTVYRWLRRR